MSTPEFVAKNHDALGSALLFFLQERTTILSLYAKERKEIGSHSGGSHPFWRIAGDVVVGYVLERPHLGKRSTSRTPIEQISDGERCSVAA